MIFLTGITGLVGSFVARKFVSEGHKIRALRRKNSDLTDLRDIADQIEWVEGDVLDIPSLEQAIEDAEYVVHCAAMVSFSPKERNQMYKVNIEGTQNVVNVCLKYSPRKFLFISSIAALGRSKESEIIDEESKWVESDLNSHYAKTKYLAEMEVWRASAEGLPVMILNPSLVLGLADWDKSSTRIFKYVWDEKIFYSKGTSNYVDVRDVAEITFRLLFSEIQNERFVINGGKSTFEVLFKLIAQSFGKKPPKYPINNFIAEVAWRVFAITSFFTGKTPLITKETARTARSSFYYANDKICKALDYQFISLEESVKWTCEELMKKYKQ